MKLSDYPELVALVKRYPRLCPARVAARLLDMPLSTFYRRVAEGQIRYEQWGKSARKRYLTEEILKMQFEEI